MANRNYDQVAGMYAQGKLTWANDSILAILVSEGVFDASQKTVSDLTANRRATSPIPGRYMADDGSAMGLPVTFAKVGQGVEYQVVVVQDVGNGNPNLLSFIEADMNGQPIVLQRSGTLIVRPVLPETPPLDRPPTVGVWMNLGI